MDKYWIRFELLSDTTFGRGEGLAGVVDQEIEYDQYGLPYLHGRTLKGLLNEECANIYYSLERQEAKTTNWERAAQNLFGGPGSGLTNEACLRIGFAQLPSDLRQAVIYLLDQPNTTVEAGDILESLTAIRRQTAIDETKNVAEQGTLRAMRVILRQTIFEAPLWFTHNPDKYDIALLAACILAWRRAGTGRNRGRGHLCATLHKDQDDAPGQDITREQFNSFAEEVRICLP